MQAKARTLSEYPANINELVRGLRFARLNRFESAPSRNRPAGGGEAAARLRFCTELCPTPLVFSLEISGHQRSPGDEPWTVFFRTFATPPAT
jgi:hypothetical protein